MTDNNDLIIPGFRFSAAKAGVKYENRLDAGLILADAPCSAAGLFTKNRLQAPAIKMDRQRLQKNGAARAVIVNAGNANTCVGESGIIAARNITAALANALGVNKSLCLMSSTGVIGEPLPENKIIDKIPELVKKASDGGMPRFARAIMTTDTRVKIASREFKTNNRRVKVAGAAKGSGMIMPNMATMLAYIVTDARVETPLLQEMLRQAAHGSLNAVTVDGDTSTSDTALVMASGKSGVDCGAKTARNALQEALNEVCLELAESIAADGEGSTRLVRVIVRGAKTEKEADKTARRIANSPLVKTAVHAADPNWGRIMAAAGSAGVALDMQKVSLEFQTKGKAAVKVVKDGGLHPAYSEKKAEEILSGKEVDIVLTLGRGDKSRTLFTCDLSSEYVKINAEYRS